MASLQIFTRGHTTGISLGHNAFWRLMMAATRDPQGGIYFSLVCRYPPIPGVSSYADSQLVLARVHVPFAQTPDEITRVADVSLMGGTLDLDTKRTAEAFNLFRNNQRTKADAIDGAIKDAGIILGAYWELREWLETGDEKSRVIAAIDYKIVCRP